MLNLVPDEGHCLSGILKCVFEAGVICFNFNDHFEVVPVELYFVFYEEGEVDGLFFGRGDEKSQKGEEEEMGGLLHWIYYEMQTQYRLIAFKIILKMKIGLEAPNGFPSHFAQQPHKYLDTMQPSTLLAT